MNTAFKDDSFNRNTSNFTTQVIFLTLFNGWFSSATDQNLKRSKPIRFRLQQNTTIVVFLNVDVTGFRCHCHWPGWVVCDETSGECSGFPPKIFRAASWWTRPCQQPFSFKRDVENRNDVINELKSGAMRWSVPGGLRWITHSNYLDVILVCEKKNRKAAREKSLGS